MSVDKGSNLLEFFDGMTSDYIIDEYIDKEYFIDLGWLIPYLNNSSHGFIAGGVFKNIVDKEFAKDIDMFFENQDSFDETVEKFSQLYIGPLYKTYNSTGFVREYGTTPSPSNTKNTLDLVSKYFGNPYEIIKRFDFIVTKFAFFKKDGKYYTIRHKDFVDQVKNRILELEPMCYEKNKHYSYLLERYKRYERYGYKASDKTLQYIISHFMKNYPEMSHIDVDSFVSDVDRLRKIFARYSHTHDIEVGSYSTSGFSVEHEYMRTVRKVASHLSHEDIKNRSLELLRNIVRIHNDDLHFVRFHLNYTALLGLEFLANLQSMIDKESFEKIFNLCINGLIIYQGSLKKPLDNWELAELSEKDDESSYNDYFIIDENVEIIRIIFGMNNNIEWVKDCAAYFSEIYDDLLENQERGRAYSPPHSFPTLKEWYFAVRSRTFDPSIDYSLMHTILIES